MDPAKLDTELPTKLADLSILEMAESSSSLELESNSRVLRKRKQTSPETGKSTRRVSLRPRKLSVVTENANSKQIEALYLNKKVKSISQTLETIYEEPKPNSSDTNSTIGGRKIKRLLTFQLGNHYTKDKIKRRRAKIKKLLGNKSFLNRKKIPMNVFLKSLECSELDEITHIESKTLETVTL